MMMMMIIIIIIICKQTERLVLANRKDIKIKNKKDSTCLLIDVAILMYRNVIQNKTEKRKKYENLRIEF
jgi:hypothetical protein